MVQSSRTTRKGRRAPRVERTPAPAAAAPFFTESRRRLLLVAVILLAAFLRLYQLTSTPPGLYPDEAMNGSNALEALETGHFQLFYPENNGREGLYINVVALFVQLFGNEPWVVRAPSAFFGILTVWGVYLLGAELYSWPIGLMASFLIATSFWHIDFSRISVRGIAAPFFLVWALYVFLPAIRHAKQGGRAYLGTMLVAGLVYGLGFHTYIAYRATPALLGGMLAYFFWRARKEGWIGAFWKGSLVFLAGSAVAALPLAIYFIVHPAMFTGRASQVSVMASGHPIQELALNMWKTAQMFFVEGDANWRHNYAARSELFWPVAILFALGVVSAARRRTFADLVLILWLLAGAAPAVFSDEGVPHALRSILMIPPVFMLAACGGHWLYTSLVSKLSWDWRVPATCVFLLVLAYEPYHTYFDLWAPHPNVAQFFTAPLVSVADQINTLPKETPKYVGVLAGGAPVNGIPMPAQTVMFLTRSYTAREQQQTHIHYVVPPTPAAAPGFCKQLADSHPKAAVFCIR